MLSHKHAQCDKHSWTELISGAQHWMESRINKVKAGPIAAGRSAGPAKHIAFSVRTEGGLFLSILVNHSTARLLGTQSELQS